MPLLANSAPALLVWLMGLQAAGAQTPAADEISTRDEFAFRSDVNLVMVPVVVRDGKGRAVGGLNRPDFQLFDRGKLQEITRFSVETGGAGGKEAEPGGRPAVPNHFVAYLFDDIHDSFAGLARARDAAGGQVDTLGPSSRAAIFTTSGRVVQEFTGDRAQLHQALARIQPWLAARGQSHECPDISHYAADRIVNFHDPEALAIATKLAETCAKVSRDMATGMANDAAQRRFYEGNHESRMALEALRDLVRRMAALSGTRTIVLISPGFFAPAHQAQKADILERAVRANVVIGSLNTAGLAAYSSAAAMANTDVLAEAAAGTGGGYIHNNNDFRAGLEQLARPPEVIYHLGFAPPADGAFHPLKVVLTATRHLEVEARKGYYSPPRREGEEEGRRAIEEALYSRDERREIPARLRTGFVPLSDQSARLSADAHLDVRQLPFRKAEDRNRDDVTLAVALFDRDGGCIDIVTKVIEFRLKDGPVAERLAPGLDARVTFDVGPGPYVVRMVLRDSEGRRMTALSSAIVIAM